MIELPTPWPIGPINAYVLHGSPLTLVDTGPRTREAFAALEAGFASVDLAVADIELLVLTHQHPDHVGNAGEIAALSGAAVAAFAPLVEQFRDFEDSLARQRQYACTVMARHGMTPTERTTIDRMKREEAKYSAAVDIDLPLVDGDILEAGDRTFRVLHRPGHSPSDLVFLDETDGTLITGDHLLPTISSNPLTSLPLGTDDVHQASREDARSRPLVDYLRSLQLTRALDASCALPGHGHVFTGTRALVDERTAHHYGRAREIRTLLADGPMTARALVDALWRDLPASVLFLGMSEVLAHLDVLEAHAAVSKEPIADADDGLVYRHAEGLPHGVV